MNKIKMIRCQVSGKLVPEEECNEIELTYIIHKSVDINDYKFVKIGSDEEDIYVKTKNDVLNDKGSYPKTRTLIPKSIKEDSTEVVEDVQDDPDKLYWTGKEYTNRPIDETKVKELFPKRKAIPAGMLGNMIDPSNPEFETKGSKETRRV